MPAKKRGGKEKPAQRCKIPWYLSAHADGKEARFLQVGNDFFFGEPFRMVSVLARFVYICMRLEAGGKNEFVFSRSAFTKYGLKQRSTTDAIEELVQSGLVSKKSGKATRTANLYRFSEKVNWPGENFIQIGNSVFFSINFKNLSPGERLMYLCLAHKAGGASEIDFPNTDFPRYGFTERTAWRYLRELEKAGFVGRNSGRYCWAPSRYKFKPAVKMTG